MDLEIDGSMEEQMATMRTTLREHHRTLHGNGQPGIVEFVYSTKAQFRLLVGMISVLMLIATVCLVLEGLHR